MSEGDSRNNCRVVEIPFPFVHKKVECVGAAFLRYYSIKCHGEDALFQTSETDEKAEGVIFEDDVEYLRSLDPKEWKQQDHYAVLGIKSLRYKATDDDIKRAYRQKVLKHHPDKRKAQGEEVRSDDDYFTCITKAYEFLGTPIKRRSYDSVDPEFDDSIPTQAEVKKGFFKAFTKVFEQNTRWSEKRNVPQLGDDNSTREQVEKFYAFWYEFDSWREFSYMDEEEKEKGQDREERRWIEKQNKTARAKLKKEEMARIRSLVDLAYNHDPRIQRFKQEDKDKKLAAKMARQSAVQAKKAEEERLVKEALLAKQRAEEAERARIEAARAEREQVKKLIRKERKALRDLCKTNNFYAQNEEETVSHMAAVEKICEMMKVLELQDFIKSLEKKGRSAFVSTMKETEDKLEAERRSLFENKKSGEYKVNKKDSALKAPMEWSGEMTQMLIKAVNLFPAGTNQRWEVVANFLNQHGTFTDERRFNAKEVLNKAKDLQSTDYSKSNLKKAANEEAFDQFEKEKKKTVATVDDDSISKNDTVEKKLVNGTAKPKMNGDVPKEPKPEKEKEKEKEKEVPKEWTKSEQELLEQAIKTFPVSTTDRWDKIADCLPNRSKKDCMKRYKELVELVKAKKQAANLAK